MLLRWERGTAEAVMGWMIVSSSCSSSYHSSLWGCVDYERSFSEILGCALWGISLTGHGFLPPVLRVSRYLIQSS